MGALLQDSPMPVLKHCLSPIFAGTLVMLSSQVAVAQQPTRAAATVEKADSAEIQAYRLTMDDVRKLYSVNLALARLARTHPEIVDTAQDTTDASPTVTDLTRQMDAKPLARDAVRVAGLTSRQYFVITFALTYASLNHQAMIMCGHNAQCVAAEAKINPANLAFINQHQAELQRLQQQFVADSSKSP